MEFDNLAKGCVVESLNSPFFSFLRIFVIMIKFSFSYTQLPPELSTLKLVAGTPCDNLHGYCDVFAVCRRVDMEGPLLRLKQKFFTIKGKVLHTVLFPNTSQLMDYEGVMNRLFYT